MRDNTVVATIEGDGLYAKTKSIFQYDRGLVLVINGITLPEEYDVHFSNTNSASTKTQKGNSNGVEIPDEYLRNGEDVHAYLYLHIGEDDGETVCHIHIPVVSRPSIGIEDVTPIEHEEIEKALARMEIAVEQTETNVSHYPYINRNHYWMVWDAVQNRYVDTGVRASAVDSGVHIYDTQTDQDVVTIVDGADGIPIDEMRIAIIPTQEGSGAAGPRNIRRINGVSELTLEHQYGADIDIAYHINISDIAGVVYGCMYYPITGVLLVDHVLVTKRCVDMNNLEVQPGWKNSGIREIVGTNVSGVFTNQMLNIGTSFGVDTTGENDLLYLGYEQYHMRQQDWIDTEINVQICVPLANPIEYVIENPLELFTYLGNNTFSTDAGKIAYIKYPCDIKLYIDRKIAEVQAMVLEE